MANNRKASGSSPRGTTGAECGGQGAALLTCKGDTTSVGVCYHSERTPQFIGPIHLVMNCRGGRSLGAKRGNACPAWAGPVQRACDPPADVSAFFSGSHSSAGQSVRQITVRSAVQARVGPLGQGVDSQGAPGASMRGAHAPMFTLCDLGMIPSSSGPYM